MAVLKITDASGREWQQQLSAGQTYSIGRSPSNQIVLHDPRVSRQHAQVRAQGNGDFVMIDGYEANGEVRRSVNHVFVNGEPQLEKILVDGDCITIGASQLCFERPIAKPAPEPVLRYDDQPLGGTQMLLSASEVISFIGRRAQNQVDQVFRSRDEELEELRRKAKVLEALYEMSKTLGAVFNLETIFDKATEIIFRVTPAERVVALLKPENASAASDELVPIATKARTSDLSVLTTKLTVSRTITRKVLADGLALLSQDTRGDAQFSAVESIVSQGVRSTICAPLVTESGVHGVLYADRLDPFARFSRDDLELISAVGAQTAVSVETVRAHNRLAREEIARANYSRFLPPVVVQQILENPDSFKLGGTSQTLTVLFADIRGFTRFSEHEPPERVVTLLNRYFSIMTEIIFEAGGTLDKYIGDGLMALFGAPTASPRDAANAVAAAIEMQRKVRDLNRELMESGREQIGVGVGLHTGEAVVGYMGCDRRSEYTAIGDTVNLAARLESNALAGQILLSGVTAAQVQNQFPLLPRTPITVKNRVQPVPLFEAQWN